VSELRALAFGIRGTLNEWLRLRWADLQLSEGSTALLLLGVLIAGAILMGLLRGLRWRQAPRAAVVLPAVLPVIRRSLLPSIRHAPFLIFLLGFPFFAVALADPRTGFTREEVSNPGRRIALLVDGSSSMLLKFETSTLKTQSSPAFFTAVAAAERFVKLRMSGPYRDLISLVQFGNEAYVVTPFTTDYENILLSTRLISEPKEWGRFPDWGTTIMEGINQGTQLFKAFDFLNASGNLMVIFTDGRDAETDLRGQPIENVVGEARRYKIPVYMIRTAFKMKLGDVREDKLWKAAIERTGGRFYAAFDESAILEAVREIDRLSPGKIDVRVYTAQEPRFSGYALIAVLCWLAAAILKLGFRTFRTFP
jgi:hypothetical protein